MSDGPHRSLKMRQGWKKVAEFAGNRNFALEEVSSATAASCIDDWRADVANTLVDAVCKILGNRQDSLFADQKVMQLEVLRQTVAGHGFAQVLIDCAVQHAIKLGPDAAVEATAQTLSIWGVRHARQIEEHYCRESTERRAQHVRSRIEQGIGGVSYERLARQLLKLDGQRAPRTRSKKTGFDDGVQL